MATSRQVDEYGEANSELTRAALAEMQAYMNRLDWSNPNSDRLAAAFTQELIEIYGDTSAGLAAQYYDEIREGSRATGAYRALTAGVVSGQVSASVSWALTADSMNRLSGVVDRLVKQAGRDTFFGNVANDSDRSARWIRVPQGETCAFCLMLASRGYDGGYSSGKAAGYVSGARSRSRGSRDIGEKFHDHCDCKAVQVYSVDDYPDNYDYERYNEIYQKGIAEAGSMNTKAILSGIRTVTGSH